MPKIQSQFYLLLLTCLTITLSACGGGNNNPDNPQATEAAKLGGVASKGLLINAKVEAYAISAAGVIADTAIASTQTDEFGIYELEVSASGMFLVKVSPAADGSSKMRCDAFAGCSHGANVFAFGELMPMDFSMEAIVSSVDAGENIRVAVTPLTHLAAQYAQNAGVTPTAIDEANQRIAMLFGIVDILETQPLDITNKASIENIAASIDASKYGYFNAAIASIASANQSDIANVLGTLSTNYINGDGELIAKESTDSAEVISFSEITSAARNNAEMLSSTGVANKQTVIDDIVNLDLLSSASAADSPTETYLSQTTQLEIQKAKLLTTTTRTWSPAITESINQNSIDFEQNLAMAGALGQMEAMLILNSFNAATSSMINLYLSQINTGLVDGDYPLNPAAFHNPYFNSVGVVGNINISGDKISISNAQVTYTQYALDENGQVTTPLLMTAVDVNLAALVPTATQNSSFRFITTDVNRVETENFLLSFDGGDLTVSWNDTVDFSNPNIMISPPNEFSASLQGLFAQKQTELNPNPVSFSGGMTIGTTYLMIGEMDFSLNPSHINLQGEIADTVNSFAAELTFNFNNASSFMPVTHQWNRDGEDFQNWRDIDLSLTFTAQFNELPPVIVTLSADRTGLMGANLGASFEHGEFSIEVMAAISEDVAPAISFVVTASGTTNRITVYPDANGDGDVGTVVINNKVVGTIRPAPTMDGVLIVRYVDGSFETLNF